MTDVIRPCTDQDLEAILEMINDAARAYKGAIPEDRYQEPYMPAEELSREIEHGVRFWGFEQDGRLLGVMGLQDVEDVTLIRHAYVRTTQRRRHWWSAAEGPSSQSDTTPSRRHLGSR